MSEFLSPQDILNRVQALDSRYHERAYLFVLAGLEYCQRRRSTRGHISGEELSRACRDFALDEFGLTARTVLSHWGIDGTQDIGRIVFHLIEVGLLMRQDSDRIEDFQSVYDFAEAFDECYPWPGIGPRRAGFDIS